MSVFFPLCHPDSKNACPFAFLSSCLPLEVIARKQSASIHASMPVFLPLCQPDACPFAFLSSCLPPGVTVLLASNLPLFLHLCLSLPLCRLICPFYLRVLIYKCRHVSLHCEGFYSVSRGSLSLKINFANKWQAHAVP
jgi:hypothetical protein